LQEFRSRRFQHNKRDTKHDKCHIQSKKLNMHSEISKMPFTY